MPLKKVELRPVKLQTDDFDRMEVYLRDLFKREIYDPLITILRLPKSTLKNSKTIANASDGLIEAIKSGRIYFEGGKFGGKLSAKISSDLKKAGATWDAKSKVWRLPKSKLGADLEQTIAASEYQHTKMLESVAKRIERVLPEEVAESFHGQPFFDSALYKTDNELRATMRAITVTPKLTDIQRAKIAEDYTNNMRLFISDFTQKQIKTLRAQIQENVFKGNRREAMIKTIQDSYNVSAGKAKFLARQETSLMMTTFKQTRYKQAGVNRYKWHAVTGSPLHPVRKAHQALADLSKKGDTFSWDDPPITTEPGEPVRRNNPGQDYNCRCFAIPVVVFTEESK